QMGIVYNVNYLVWFEAARTELLREAGLPYSEMERRGYYLPVIETGARFLKSARYDDLAEITAVITELKKTSLRIDYEVHCNGELLVTGFTRHAVTDKNGTLRRLPVWMNDVLRRCLHDS
ncbi:acyl-CoA thioesterase, partial [bacterium]|nr:acyl-CoA thioesterase [bacterium]